MHSNGRNYRKIHVARVWHACGMRVACVWHACGTRCFEFTQCGEDDCSPKRYNQLVTDIISHSVWAARLPHSRFPHVSQSRDPIIAKRGRRGSCPAGVVPWVAPDCSLALAAELLLGCCRAGATQVRRCVKRSYDISERPWAVDVVDESRPVPKICANCTARLYTQLRHSSPMRGHRRGFKI